MTLIQVRRLKWWRSWERSRCPCGKRLESLSISWNTWRKRRLVLQCTTVNQMIINLKSMSIGPVFKIVCAPLSSSFVLTDLSAYEVYGYQKAYESKYIDFLSVILRYMDLFGKRHKTWIFEFFFFVFTVLVQHLSETEPKASEQTMHVENSKLACTISLMSRWRCLTAEMMTRVIRTLQTKSLALWMIFAEFPDTTMLSNFSFLHFKNFWRLNCKSSYGYYFL